MKLQETKKKQEDSLKTIALENDIAFDNLKELIKSSITKKLLKRNNYHQITIDKIIEKEIK